MTEKHSSSYFSFRFLFNKLTKTLALKCDIDFFTVSRTIKRIKSIANKLPENSRRWHTWNKLGSKEKRKKIKIEIDWSDHITAAINQITFFLFDEVKNIAGLVLANNSKNFLCLNRKLDLERTKIGFGKPLSKKSHNKN